MLQPKKIFIRDFYAIKKKGLCRLSCFLSEKKKEVLQKMQAVSFLSRTGLPRSPVGIQSPLLLLCSPLHVSDPSLLDIR